MTFASKVLCRVVCSGSAAHGIERFTSMGLLRCRRGPQLRSVPDLQQELRARVILWADYTNLVQHLKDKHAQLHREFQQIVEVQSSAFLANIASSLKVKIAYESVG